MTDYAETDCVTYDDARSMVDEYIDERGDTVSYITAKKVCVHAGVEHNDRNRSRIHRVLKRRFPKCDDWSSRTVRYEVDP